MVCLIFTDRFVNCLTLMVKTLQSFGTSDCSPGDTPSQPEDFSLQRAGAGNLTSKVFDSRKNNIITSSVSIHRFKVIIVSSVTPMGELKLVTSWTHLSDCAVQQCLVFHLCCLVLVSVQTCYHRRQRQLQVSIVMSVMYPAFEGAGKEPGLLIWRIEVSFASLGVFVFNQKQVCVSTGLLPRDNRLATPFDFLIPLVARIYPIYRARTGVIAFAEHAFILIHARQVVFKICCKMRL